MDARDKLAEKEDELMRLTEALTACQLDRDSRPVVSPDAPPTEKDQALAELDKEVRELRCILGDTDRDYNAAIRMARRTAAREWQLKCEALEGQLEAQKALHEDALAQVAVERKVRRLARSCVARVIRASRRTESGPARAVHPPTPRRLR
jgi:centromeric protein E